MEKLPPASRLREIVSDGEVNKTDCAAFFYLR
jgi:hypothetical protein